MSFGPGRFDAIFPLDDFYVMESAISELHQNHFSGKYLQNYKYDRLISL